MANMTNIKIKIYILVTAAALILCGCEENGESGLLDSDTESSSSASTAYVTEVTEAAETTEITEATEATEITEAAKTTEEIPNETDVLTDYINGCFEVREFPDDEIVPAEWIPVYSFAEAAKNFDEIVSADVSNMDTADAIIALANKNVIFTGSFKRWLFWDLDADHPYYSENYKNPLYPDKPIYPLLLSSEYYTDIQEIYDLGSETYSEDALNYFYTTKEGETKKPFLKENGVSYVDFWIHPVWDILPFRYRTYIEIVSETENKCSFIWHTPDLPGVDLPHETEEGYEFCYHNSNCEAVYENGSWKLSKVYVEIYSLERQHNLSD